MDSELDAALANAQITPAVIWSACVTIFGAVALVRILRGILRERGNAAGAREIAGVPAWDASLPQLCAFLAIAIFCLLGVGLICGYAARAIFPEADLRNNLTYLVPAMQPLALVAMLVFVIFASPAGAFPRPLSAAPERRMRRFLSVKNRFGVPALFGAAVVLVTLATALTLAIVQFLPEGARAIFQENQALVQELSDPGKRLAFALSVPAIAIFTPILEELIFRVGLYRFLKSRVPAVFAAILSSVIFALLHDAPVSYLPLAVLGCLLCFAYEKTGRVAAPILVHALFNANTLLLIALGAA